MTALFLWTGAIVWTCAAGLPVAWGIGWLLTPRPLLGEMAAQPLSEHPVRGPDGRTDDERTYDQVGAAVLLADAGLTREVWHG